MKLREVAFDFFSRQVFLLKICLHNVKIFFDFFFEVSAILQGIGHFYIYFALLCVLISHIPFDNLFLYLKLELSLLSMDQFYKKK